MEKMELRRDGASQAELCVAETGASRAWESLGTWCEGSIVEMLDVGVDGKPGNKATGGAATEGQGGEGSGASRERTEGCC